MRGDDQQSGHLFSYLSPEQRVPADHPLRAIRQMTDEALRQLSPQFEAIYAKTRPAVDAAGAAAAGAAAAGALHGAQRADADRAARIQPAVSLVRRAGHGRRGVDADDVHEEPRAPARGRHRPAVLRGGAGAGAWAPAAVGRALHGRRHPARGVGRPEELHAQGRHEPPGRRTTIPAIRPSISMANGARTTRTNRRPIPTAAWRRRPVAAKPSWRISAKC